MDIFLEGHSRFRNSDLALKKIYNFNRQNISSTFRNTGKLIPFVFRGANTGCMLLKMRNKVKQLVNSGKKISFPTTFYEFNFQLKHLNIVLTDQTAYTE